MTGKKERKKPEPRSKSARGNYYKLKSIKFLKAQGYDVEETEKKVPKYIAKKGKVIYIKVDLWGSDLLAKSKDEIIFVQVRSNAGDVSTAIRHFEGFMPFPPQVDLWVMLWHPGKRNDVPDITRREDWTE